MTNLVEFNKYCTEVIIPAAVAKGVREMDWYVFDPDGAMQRVSEEEAEWVKAEGLLGLNCRPDRCATVHQRTRTEIA